MANALTWITKEAKRLRRQYPKRFASWKEYVAQASAIYASKHKGNSPVGHKHKGSTMHRKKRAPTRPKKKKATHHRRRRVGGSGISTRSKRHTDNNRQRTYITIGDVRKDTRKAKEKLDKLIGQEYVRYVNARLKRIKKKISKKLTTLKAQRRRLAV